MDQVSPQKSPSKFTLPPISRTNFTSPMDSPRGGIAHSMRGGVGGLDTSMISSTPDIKEPAPLRARALN